MRTFAKPSLRRLLRRPEAGALVGLLVVYAFFAVEGTNGFTTAAGTASWLNTAAELGVLAMPVGLLMIGGEFDLSVGSVIGASSILVSATSGVLEWPLWLAVLAALSFGALVGLSNGLVTIGTRLPSFIVTIASMFIVAGLALGLSRLVVGTTSVGVDPRGSVALAFGSQWHGYNISVVWWLAVTAIAAWILSNTAIGSWIFASGANRDAARAAGVPVAQVKLGLFTMAGIGASLVGVLQCIQYRTGDVTFGRDFVFAAPVAAVIGGVLLTGGYGSALGIFIGTAIYGVVNLGMFYTGWDSEWAQLVLGMLLLLAVLGNNVFRRLALSGT